AGRPLSRPQRHAVSLYRSPNPESPIPNPGSLSRPLLHAAFPRVHRGLRAVADIEFAEHIADVGLDRLFADAQAFGDQLVAEALGDQGQGLAFALTERFEYAAGGFHAAPHRIHQACSDARMQYGLAPG